MPRKSSQALERLLEERSDDGRRRVVPVFGHGLNIQAYSEIGERQGDSWSAALKQIISELDAPDRRRLKRFPPFHQSAYDELYRLYRDPTRRSRDTNDFLGRLGTLLQRGDQCGQRCPLYRDLQVTEFSNIVTTCIDETLPNAVGATRRRKHARSIGRKPRATDIWQMYGSAMNPERIRLGCIAHAETTAELENQRGRLLNSWPRRSSGQLAPPVEFGDDSGPLTMHWFKQFMVAPLLFIGASLDLSDWTLWWVLHQRARVFAMLDPEHRPKTVVLTSAEHPLTHLAGSPAGIEQIEFATFDVLWAHLRKLLQ